MKDHQRQMTDEVKPAFPRMHADISYLRINQTDKGRGRLNIIDYPRPRITGSAGTGAGSTDAATLLTIQATTAGESLLIHAGIALLLEARELFNHLSVRYAELACGTRPWCFCNRLKMPAEEPI